MQGLRGNLSSLSNRICPAVANRSQPFATNWSKLSAGAYQEVGWGTLLRKFAIACSALAFSGSAFAADFSGYAPVYPVASWSGCYLGANVGVGWQYNSVYDPAYDTSAGSDTGTGVVGGGQLGCDFQFAGNWVLGIQGMFDGADVSGNHLVPFYELGDYSETMSFKTTWYGTLTGRIGYAFLPSALLYFKGGGAWAHVNYTDVDPNGLPPYAGQAGATLGGWTGGVGLEYLLRPNWSVFLEYDYVDFGTHNVTINYGGGSVYNFQETHALQALLFGVNYRFGGLW